jgi:hypothetical protein
MILKDTRSSEGLCLKEENINLGLLLFFFVTVLSFSRQCIHTLKKLVGKEAGMGNTGKTYGKYDNVIGTYGQTRTLQKGLRPFLKECISALQYAAICIQPHHKDLLFVLAYHYDSIIFKNLFERHSEALKGIGGYAPTTRDYRMLFTNSIKHEATFD